MGVVKIFDWDDTQPQYVGPHGGNPLSRKPVCKNAFWNSGESAYYNYTSMTLSTKYALDGERNALKVLARVDPADPRPCRLKYEIVTQPGSPTGWYYMKDARNSGDAWALDDYNRIRFAVRLPENGGDTLDRSDLPDCSYKTYHKWVDAGTPNAQSSTMSFGEGEFQGECYHSYKTLIKGCWHFYIIDTHSIYMKNVTDRDRYDTYYPYSVNHGQTDQNWIDQLTYSYFHLNTYPDPAETRFEWHIGHQYAYRDVAEDDNEDIFEVHGAYHPGTQELAIGWAVMKEMSMVDRGVTPYNIDVKYAFSDIRTLGWANATAFPGGTNIANPNSANPLLQLRTQGFDPGANPFIYVGIKSQRKPDTEFRQIVLPATLNGNPPIPGA